MTLAGRAALVTGSSQGLGLAIGSAFAREGAHVLLCARGAADLEAARAQVAGVAAPGVRVLARTADVAEAKQVESLVALAIESFGALDVLVANAGIYGPMGPLEDTDPAAWEEAIRINLVGTMLACRAVLPHMKARRRGKVIVVSGGGATKPMPYLSAYAASKAGAVRFAETLAEEVQEHGIDVNAIAPGALATRLLDQVLAAGAERVGEGFHAHMSRIKAEGGTPLEVGASLAVWLASPSSDGITGKLLSAVWDPWPALAEYAEELRRSDVYTLRRIVPADRGKTWGEP